MVLDATTRDYEVQIQLTRKGLVLEKTAVRHVRNMEKRWRTDVAVEG